MSTVPNSSLSSLSRSVQLQFLKLIANAPPLSSDILNTTFSSQMKSEKQKNLFLASFRAIAPKLNSSQVFNALVALNWMATSLSMRGMEYECLAIHGLCKLPTESFSVYIARMRKLIGTSHIGENIVALVKVKYAENLVSPYLPTEYFNEFNDLDYDLLNSFYAIFTDPYPRSKIEWQERVTVATQLYGDSIDIPTAKSIIKTNESPSTPVSATTSTTATSHMLPYLTLVLSRSAVMNMVHHWDSDDFATIANTMRVSPLANAITMHGGFLHGMMQYIATESAIAPNGPRILYRGVNVAGPSALEAFFPIDENGHRRSLKDTSLIATSRNEEVAGDMYADNNRTNMSLPPSRGLLMHITPCTGAPITSVSHTAGQQDEALLLPGSFTFVKHLETKKSYDVIAVKYKPDFSIMKMYPGVWSLWETRTKSN